MGLLRSPSELTAKSTFTGLVYGQPGVGKSTLALSAPNPVCIDTDGGMYRIDKRYQVAVLQPSCYDDVLELLNGQELASYETVVVDTLGKLIDLMGVHVGAKYPKYRQSNGILTMQGWGVLKQEFSALVRLLRGLDKNLIFVAHESEEKEGDVTRKRPDASGSARKDIVKELDWMGYMEVTGGKRTISFEPGAAHYAKNSLGLDKVIEIPPITERNDFIVRAVIGTMQERAKRDRAMALDYDCLRNELDIAITAAQDLETINRIYAYLGKAKHVWDSKLWAWNLLINRAAQLGLKYDRGSNGFVVNA
jgi:hypothetical protein